MTELVIFFEATGLACANPVATSGVLLDMNEKIELTGVPETMLQTLYARAKESRTRGAVTDKKAEEIIEKLDYDFSLADSDVAMSSGVIARTIVLDKMVSSWLCDHPDAVVVNIACGLDTRCYRMAGFKHWYNLDLPETIAVRAKLLPEDGAISQIAMSAMDDRGSVIKESAPTLVIIEGLTMYLTQEDVQRIFEIIAARFETATVFVETMNPVMVRRWPSSCRTSALCASTGSPRAWRSLFRYISCSTSCPRCAASRRTFGRRP